MSPERRLSRASFGARATFALAGALCAVWTVRMPALQSKLGLSDAQLGLEVLGWGVGALITMLLAGRILGRHGSRRVLRAALPATAVSLALVGLAPNYALLIAAGLVFGLCFGLVDVAMNTQASTVERRYGRPLMGRMHAGWSLGAVAGGLLGAVTAWIGLGFTAALCVVAVLLLPAVLAVGPTYLGADPSTGPSADPPTDSHGASDAADPAGSARHQAARRAAPKPRLPMLVFLFGALVFCSYLAEGAVADWSGVYLHDTLGATEVVAALGYPMFEACMFVGRMRADRLTLRFGARRLIITAGLASAAAFALVAAAPVPMVGLVGFAAVGLAVCTVTPLVMSLAGAAGGAQTERAIAAASTMGYSGLLLGPVAIGFVSTASSMHLGYALTAGVVCLAIALGGRFVPRGQHIRPVEPAAQPAATAAPPTRRAHEPCLARGSSA
ncbi:MFS transporter [Actinospica durhamensis]|uniref:MFS transporter n=1 Tax=Actinospica durhamensis TaxID=1508375 RepID=A0A941IP43_9ACTN|nr:MFS transporter [Actinospica durhamensis]MBR7832722.1 MFS transporter [Actinospica durhamensis]